MVPSSSFVPLPWLEPPRSEPAGHARAPSVPTARRAVWRNAVGSASVRGLAYVPRSRDDVLAVVQAARTAGQRLRAVGAGTSSSGVACPDETWIDLRHLTRVLPLGGLRREVDPTPFVRVEAGIEVDALHAQLYARGLALPVANAYGKQTLAGAIATASHGSSLRHGPLADAVVAVELVVLDGDRGAGEPRLVRLEPEGGISCPTRFGRDRAHAGMALVQDDDLFHGAVVGLGATGIAVAYVLAVRPAFHLAERRFVTSWAALAPELGRLATAHAFCEVELFPHAPDETRRPGSRDARIACLVTTRRPIPLGERRERDDPERRSLRWLGLLGDGLGWAASRAPGRLLAVVEANFKEKLALQRRRGELAGPAHVLQRTSLGEWVKLDATEVSVPLEDASRAVAAVLDEAEALAAEGLRFSAPISLRFVGPSRHAMAMSHGRATAALEAPLLVGTHRRGGHLRHAARDTRELLRRVGEAVTRVVPSARPHWGFTHTLDAGDLPTLYPRASSWWRACVQLDPQGAFTNAMTRELLDGALLTPASAPSSGGRPT